MTDNTLHFITIGILLGVSAGLSPGPLLTLVISQTIKHNRKEGIKVAISPLITDLPIILIALFIFNRLAEFDLILAIISLAGGVFVAYLGIEALRIKGLNIDIQDSKSESIKKGIIANFLSPSPYLFWVTVGTPLIFNALKINLLSAILFLISFYVFLIGSKVLIAVLVAQTKVFMNQKTYIIIMRILGLALLSFSFMFFYDGIKYLQQN
jgi:threonine/homoserine/homoserine lactone efflux protein